MAKKKEKEQLTRICVLGAAFSGKSSLCNRFVNNSFEWLYEPTNEVNIFRKLINITEDEENKQYCMMQIEDLFPVNHHNLQLPRESSAEVEKMIEYYDRVLGNKRSDKKKSNEKTLYKETFIEGYMFVYDVNSSASLEEIVRVIDYIHIREEKEAGKKKSGIAAKILVGTKKDAPGLQSQISNNTIEQYKKKYNLLTRKVSALTNSEVTEAFLDLARNAIDRSSGNNNKSDSKNKKNKESGGILALLGCVDRDDQEKDSGKCVIF